MKYMEKEIHMNAKNILTAIVASLTGLLLVSAPLQVRAAKGHIEMRTEVRKVETYTDKEGNKKQREVKPDKVIPSDELLYTIYFRNVSKESASNIVINDPIPENMRYKKGSAFGSGTEITFSVDGGKTFATPDKLKVNSGQGGLKTATETDYTHIRWIFKPVLGPGEKGTVQFRAILK